MTLQFNAYVLYYWWGGAALMAAVGALARRRFAALWKILLGAAAAALGVWLQQQLPESIGFAIQAVLMLVSAVLILLGIVATFTAEES
jgi:predicted ABC-type exoprotein transport system permease subunit